MVSTKSPPSSAKASWYPPQPSRASRRSRLHHVRILFRLGDELFSPWVGAVAALVVLTRPAILRDTLLGYQDVPFAALKLAAEDLRQRLQRAGVASVPNELRARRRAGLGAGASSAAGVGGGAGTAFLAERPLGAGGLVGSSGRYLILFGIPGISILVRRCAQRRIAIVLQRS